MMPARSAAWLAALVVALLPAPAAAQTFPPASGYVVDAADLLSPEQEAALTTRLEALDRATGNQLAVATIPDLEGRPIEDYGVGLIRAWGVGQEGTNNGAILIVAPGERAVRIEVGYGLEGVLTDALSSVVINQTILPRFREGDMAGGIVAGAEAIAAQIGAPPEEQAARAAEADARAAEARERGGGVNWIAIGFWAIVLLMVLGSAIAGGMRSGRGRRGRRYRKGNVDWPVMLWTVAQIASAASKSGGSGGGWGGGGGGGGFGGFGGGSGGGGGASGSW